MTTTIMTMFSRLDPCLSLLPMSSLQLYMSFHSYGQKVLYPWSYTSEKIYDWSDLERVGIKISDAIFKESKGRYVYQVRDGVSRLGGDYSGIVNHVPVA